ncbi:MAG: CHAP domain-containing protein [Eubacterium sp.]|nr:CHAP domain-containing protein [Eubacterium sp.]
MINLNFNEFIKKYEGSATDYDKTSGVQCVDLAKLYIEKVIGASPEAIGNAHAYYDLFDKTYLKKFFKKIRYEKGIKPKRGDLVVWGLRYNGTSKYGHIAIANGKADSKTLKTYDQNYGIKAMHLVEHSYSGISGFLRPIDRSRVSNPPKVACGAYKLTNVRGVYNDFGSASGRKKVKDLTPDGKKNAVCTKSNAEAFLKAGTTVSISKTKVLPSGNLWAKIPSGYICVWEEDSNKTFIE